MSEEWDRCGCTTFICNQKSVGRWVGMIKKTCIIRSLQGGIQRASTFVSLPSSNMTYCDVVFVFLFFFRLCCHFSGLSILFSPALFSNDYFIHHLSITSSGQAEQFCSQILSNHHQSQICSNGLKHVHNGENFSYPRILI